VAAADDGSVYLAGYTASFGAGDGDAFLVKFNATGSQLWNHTWGGLSEDDGAAVVVYSDMVYLTGYTWSFSAGWSDAFLAKFNSTGAQLWNRTWGGIQWDVAKGGAASMDGTINIAGATGSDAFLAKYDASGTLLWNRTWGGLGWAEGWGVAATTDGSLFLAGLTAPLEEDADAFLVKFSAAGDQLWSQTWGGAGEDHGLDVAAAAGGVIYVTGSTNSSGAGGYDAFLAKLTIVMPSPDYTWLVMLLIIGGAAVAIVLAIITVKKRRPASPAI